MLYDLIYNFLFAEAEVFSGILFILISDFADSFQHAAVVLSARRHAARHDSFPHPGLAGHAGAFGHCGRFAGVALEAIGATAR